MFYLRWENNYETNENVYEKLEQALEFLQKHAIQPGRFRLIEGREIKLVPKEKVLAYEVERGVR